jgi:P27 family predicted phage terminase small subunit
MSTRGRKPEFQVIEGGLSDRPEIPAHIPTDLHPEWQAVIDDLTRRKMLTEAVLPTIETYVQAIGNARTAQRAIDQHGALVIGRDGVPKQNPAVSLLGKCNSTITRLSAELGLTPASRSRKNMSGNQEAGDDCSQANLFDV